METREQARRSRRHVLTVLVAAVALLLDGCSMVDFGSQLVGVWVFSNDGAVETWVFTKTTVSVTDTNFGTVTGTMSSTIQSNSVTAGHLQMVTISSSGYYAPSAPGTVWYVTYSLMGDTLYLSGSPVAFPATAASGPYMQVR